jgi:hypothetical protein
MNRIFHSSRPRLAARGSAGGLTVGILGAWLAMAGAGRAAGGEVLYYQFNTGPNGAPVATAVDSGPNHLNGVVTGPLTYSSLVAPKGGTFSLNATGDVDYITLAQTSANQALLNPTLGLTLSALAYPTGGTTMDSVGDLVAGKLADYETGSCDTTYGIWWTSTSQHFVGGVCDVNRNFTGVVSTDSFAANAWHAVVLKVSTNKKGAAMAKLTVDGKAEGSMSLKAFPGFLTGDGAFQVGASNINCDSCTFRRNFVGYIDQVKLIGVNSNARHSR